jgi:hypothetical protein
MNSEDFQTGGAAIPLSLFTWLSEVNFGFPPSPLQEDAAMVKAHAVQVRKFRLPIWNSEKDRFAFVLG